MRSRSKAGSRKREPMRRTLRHKLRKRARPLTRHPILLTNRQDAAASARQRRRRKRRP
jgi:hypothetical protein